MPERRFAQLLALMIVAAVLLNFPVLALVERWAQRQGLPLVPIYLFAVWAAVIGVAAWLVERRGEE